MLVRLQKYLADQGVASRRTCETYIADGFVSVNGTVVTEMGVKVDPEKDQVEYDGHAISKRRADLLYVMLNKPRGYETTLATNLDPGKRTVTHLMESLGFYAQDQRLVPVGRLDKDSEGLLIMTNDGEMVHRLTHPSFEHTKEYQVTVSGEMATAKLKRLASGVRVDGVMTAPCVVEFMRKGEGPAHKNAKTGKEEDHDRSVLRFVLTEGRKRQIRRMCESVGWHVRRLKRVRVGELTLNGLSPGHARILTPADVEKLVS